MNLHDLLDELAEEQAALDGVVADLGEAGWATPTHAEGWDVRDHVAHLAFFDEVATLAIVDADRFAGEVALAIAGIPAYEARWLERGRALPPAGVLAWWRQARGQLLEAGRAHDPGAPVPWFGPPMSPASFFTARLMETWSHGQDIVDVVDGRREDTDRLRHVVWLGVRTRAFSFRVRGLEPPAAPVRLELALPSGAIWSEGDPAAADRITGSARDFCLVVTQRRHVDDTELAVRGQGAAAWMRIAQAFAGPPGQGRPSGLFPKR